MLSQLRHHVLATALALLAALALCRDASAQYVTVKVDGFDQLDLSAAEQQKSQWCWAATIQAVLLYYGIDRSQSDIVLMTYGRTANLPALSPLQLYHTLNNFQVRGDTIDVVRGNFGYGQALTAAMLRALLQANQPIIAWYRNSMSGGHAVVIYEADFDFAGRPISVGIFDPWPGKGLQVVSAQPFGSLIQAFFVVQGASLGGSSVVTDDGGSPSTGQKVPDDDDAEQKFQDCMARMPGRCRKTCHEAYGRTPAECVVLCDPESPINVKTWTSTCRDKPRTEDD